VDHTSLDIALRKFDNIGKNEVRTLCSATPYVNDISNYVPKVIAFTDQGVAKTLIDTLPMLEAIEKSCVYMTMWKEACRRKKLTQSDSTEDIIMLILNDASTRLVSHISKKMHCLQHSFFEHLFNVWYRLVW